MAGSKLKGRVRSSGILEVIVSMVVIVIVFGVAMMIYTNVSRLSLSAKKLRAQAILESEMSKAEQRKENTQATVIIDDFSVTEDVETYREQPGLAQIKLTAFDQNQQKIATLQKVISTNHE